jgi:hypothetical protein
MKKLVVFSLMLSLISIFFTLNGAWSPPKRLTWTAASEMDPYIATYSSSTVYAVWYYWTGAATTDIYFKKSTNGGTGWSALQRLTWTASEAAYPKIAVGSGGAVYLVYRDDISGNSEVYFKNSANGSTWSTSKRLTWTSVNSVAPHIAVDSGNVIHVIWCEFSTIGIIYYKKSTDGGTTWSSPVRLTWGNNSCFIPFICVDENDYLHVAFYMQASGNNEIVYKKSTNSGATWSSPDRLTYNSGDSTYPVLAAGTGNNLYIAWHDSTPGNMEIYLKNSTNSGNSWSSPTRVTWNSGSSGRPSIATDSSNVRYLVWNDDTPGNSEIFFKKSSAWTTVERLTWNSGESFCPVIAIDSVKGIHVIWYDYTTGPTEVYYKNN